MWLLPRQAPIDFNQYLGIQRAGIACLKLPQQRVREYAAVWRQRAAALVPVLRRFGWRLPEPKACKSLMSATPGTTIVGIPHPHLGHDTLIASKPSWHSHVRPAPTPSLWRRHIMAQCVIPRGQSIM